MVQFGVSAGLPRAALTAAAGFDYIECPTNLLTVGEAEWPARLAELRALPLPLVGCNMFFPGGMKVVGPECDRGRVLAHAEQVFAHLAAAGGKLQVLGSGAHRTPPPDYPREKATAELRELVIEMAPLAAQHGVWIAVEHLQQKESGLLTSLAEAVQLVREINHPAVGLTVDAYHMGRMAEPWAVVRQCAGLKMHVHVADPAERRELSVAGTDLRPFFRELVAIGYDGPISLECNWLDFDNNAKPTLEIMKAQWADAAGA